MPRSYPCPPTSAQLTDGVSCEIQFGDQGLASAAHNISFGGSPATTTTTAPPATTTTAPPATTTTTVPCTPHSVSTANPDPASITVNPGTCLNGGTVVDVTGTGFHASSPGAVLECSNAVGQPTIQVAGNAVPISCTNPLNAITATDASGNLDPNFTIVAGTVGPPATGTDSSGGDAATDAANYPCPPTPAQVAAGAPCEIQLAMKVVRACPRRLPLSPIPSYLRPPRRR